MFLNVLLNNIVCDLLTNSSKKVALFPKMASPKLFPYARVFFQYFTARYAFQNGHRLRNTIAWRKRYQKMYMIFRYLTLLYFEVKLTGDFIEKGFYPFTHLPCQYSFSVFRAPYQMVRRLINRMACSSQCHTVLLIGKRPFLNPHRLFPMSL